VRFRRVTLEAPVALLAEVATFYEDELALPLAGPLTFQAGESELAFRPARSAPFYHFALLVPGGRFAAALEWAEARTTILPPGVFDFDFWDAQACYFHDPAGSIVELIAHRGVGENGAEGAFSGGELIGLSELGLVGDTRAMAGALQVALELPLWDGTVSEPGRLAFVGEQARTLILSPPGRGWLPTGRPAEPYPVEAVLSGPPSRSVALEDGLYTITRA
jgi:hypothetical protein